MNTRLQVEHPVTEMTTGIDIVQQQIRVARGERLTFTQDGHPLRGHAFECRDQRRGPEQFRPRRPARSREWDCLAASACASIAMPAPGYRVSPYYDSMIAKLIVHGDTREDALDRLRIALDEMQVEGIATNLPLHRAVGAGRRPSSPEVSTSIIWSNDCAKEDRCELRSATHQRARNQRHCCSRRRAKPALPRKQRIWALAKEAEGWPEIREAVPGMNNLMLSFSRPPARCKPIEDRLHAAWTAAVPMRIEGRLIELPVVYGGDGGPHMADVMAHTGLDIDRIAAIHSAPTYVVYALGSHPGYCYLGGMDQRIATPRRKTPVVSIPGGAVSIGGAQTGVSASAGPSGWNTIGSTSMRFFDPALDPPALLRPGDRLQFKIAKVIR